MSEVIGQGRCPGCKQVMSIAELPRHMSACRPQEITDALLAKLSAATKRLDDVRDVEITALKAEREALRWLLNEVAQYLPTEAEMLDSASLNEGRPGPWSMLGVKVRAALEKMRKA